jgi:hypothetical protein
VFEKFLSNNSGDFRQRYEGTFGFYRGEDGKKLLVRLEAINERVCLFIDKNGLEYRLNVDSEKDIGFDFIPPKSGYYNTLMDDGTLQPVLVSRVPARQFQRGVSSKNTKITRLIAGQAAAIPFNFPILEKIYLTALSTEEAFGRWNNNPKAGAVAISKQLALDATVGKVLLYENWIGTFKKKDTHFTCKLDEPALWRTEITDAFRALGCTTEVN